MVGRGRGFCCILYLDQVRFICVTLEGRVQDAPLQNNPIAIVKFGLGLFFFMMIV